MAGAKAPDRWKIAVLLILSANLLILAMIVPPINKGVTNSEVHVLVVRVSGRSVLGNGQYRESE